MSIERHFISTFDTNNMDDSSLDIVIQSGNFEQIQYIIKSNTNKSYLKNNKKLINLFDDYRFKKEKNHKNIIENNFLLKLIKNKISKRSYLYRIYENIVIKRYLKKIKK